MNEQTKGDGMPGHPQEERKEKMTETERNKLLRKDRLPTPSPGLSYLMSALSDDDLTMGELAVIVERYPPIVARLIGLANSGWSSPSQPIDSVEQACTRLGLNVVRNVSITLAVSSPFNPNRCRAFNATIFWCSAFLAADAAFWLAPGFAGMNPQTARTAGLLYNLGLLWMADTVPNETNLALVEAHTEDKRVNDSLIDFCGLGYDHAGAILASAWKIPENLVHAMQHHRTDCSLNGEQLTCVTYVASEMVSALIRKHELSLTSQNLGPDNAAFADKLNNVFNRLSTTYDKTYKLAESLTVAR